MSNYTTSVRFICESYAGLTESVGFDDLDRVIDAAVDKVFSWSLPVTENAAEWAELKKHILIHFYTREIGSETVGLWKLRLRQKFDGLFEYYDKLISSAKIEYGPLDEVNYTKDKGKTKNTKTNASNEAQSSSNSNANSQNRNMYSATPQSELSDIESGKYLTTYNYDSSTNEASANGNSSGTSEYTEDGTENEIETVTGRMFGKGPSQLLVEYRKTLLRIEEMICGELEPLFFGLW